MLPETEQAIQLGTVDKQVLTVWHLWEELHIAMTASERRKYFRILLLIDMIL